MSGTYVPHPDRSVRPLDLEPEEREALRRRAQDHRGRHRANRYELPLLVIAALALAFLIKTFLLQAFYIPSGSMETTLEIGDRVLVEKVSYRFREPERGEVIVFRRPGTEDERGRTVGDAARTFLEGLGLVQPREDLDLIKRVIGLPGERVAIADGVVTVDGQPLEEAYAQVDGRSFDPLTVPEGHLFMLGDNRPNSDDSRYSLGTVPLENVVGRAFVILWPPGSATLSLDRDYGTVPERRVPPAVGPPVDPAVD